jgi:hypothetical protein
MYLASYLLLGSSALLILLEIIQSGVWRRLGLPLLLIVFAMMNLARLQAVERKPANPAVRGDGKPAPQP